MTICLLQAKKYVLKVLRTPEIHSLEQLKYTSVNDTIFFNYLSLVNPKKNR